MNEACHFLRGTVPEIVGRWEQLAARAPGLNRPGGPGADHLPAVVVGLIESALCDAANPAAHRGLVHAAARRGEIRRMLGLSEAELLTDYSLLRQALWATIRTFPLSEEGALHTVAQLDMALTAATLASFRGYHRPEIERLGRWPDLLEETHRESPLMLPR